MLTISAIKTNQKSYFCVFSTDTEFLKTWSVVKYKNSHVNSYKNIIIYFESSSLTRSGLSRIKNEPSIEPESTPEPEPEVEEEEEAEEEEEVEDESEVEPEVVTPAPVPEVSAAPDVSAAPCPAEAESSGSNPTSQPELISESEVADLEAELDNLDVDEDDEDGSDVDFDEFDD